MSDRDGNRAAELRAERIGWREQLGKTSASRTVDALAAANTLGLESGSLDFDRRLQSLVGAEYLEEPANPALMAQGKYLITFEGITAADNY